MSRFKKMQENPEIYSLTELEQDDWGPAGFDSSLVQTVHQLRNKPLGELSPGDMRMLIGQRVGLRFLVPLAMDLIESDPFIDSDFYPGDLLLYLLNLSDDYWSVNHDMRDRMTKAAMFATEWIHGQDDFATTKEIQEALQKFLRLNIRVSDS